MFYAMLDDLDGKKHLVLGEDERGRPVVKAESTLAAWEQFKDGVVSRYGLSDEQKQKADERYDLYKSVLADYLAKNYDKISDYFASLDQFQAKQAEGGNAANYYEKRVWDKRQELRKESRSGWPPSARWKPGSRPTCGTS